MQLEWRWALSRLPTNSKACFNVGSYSSKRWRIAEEASPSMKASRVSSSRFLSAVTVCHTSNTGFSNNVCLLTSWNYVPLISHRSVVIDTSALAHFSKCRCRFAAGGNLAMSVTMELIKMSETSSEIQIPVMLTLINPMLQLVDFQLPSFRENSQYFFRNHFAERFWLSYLGLVIYCLFIFLILIRNYFQNEGVEYYSNGKS